jgi:hypothetical protein
MGTSVVRSLTDEEMAGLPAARAAMEEAGKSESTSPFNFFAAFDGTNNHKEKRHLSGDPHQTNVGNLFDQAETSKSQHLSPSTTPA